ncbi:hypothetical protein AAG589_13365 [Isoptericola sp. F-RaC21]|uniref:hypothetical protein n=1 Tax=Isoptericola sp. F-RaC21 TaxID=3141452 RepID=UPI00315C143C
MHQTRTRPALMAGALVAAVGALAACSAGADDPAAAPPASPSPSPSPTVDAVERESVEAAEQTLQDFYELGAKVSNSGFANWQVMQGFWTDDEQWQAQRATYEQRVADGWTTEGAATFTDVKATDVDTGDEEPGDERVTLEVCNDASGVTTLDKEGAKVPRAEGVPERFIVVYTMSARDEGRWGIDSREADTEQAC